MITDDGKKWHYLAVRSLSALLRRISSSNNGDFYCLNNSHSYRTPNKLKNHERVCNNHDYCHVDMPEEGQNILKYSPGDKSLKASFINSYTQGKSKHKLSVYSLSLNCSFDETKNRRKF